MQIGLIGKPSSGKSTFWNAATLGVAEVSSRPFTTIKANQGTGYITRKCVHEELGVECEPMNSKCEQGIRLIPATLLDVAGLIEGAWEGKGLGNQFMNDLMQASALIHVLDTAGATDAEGNPVKAGEHDPAEDVHFLEREIDYWIKGILKKNWGKISKQATVSKKPWESLGNQLSGLGIGEESVKETIGQEGFSQKPDEWSEEEILRFATVIRKKNKPLLIAANKMDLPGAEENLKKLREKFPEHIFVPCCAEAELALRKAEKAGVIEYVPGEGDFKLLKEDIEEKQKKALEFIRENILKKFGSTGVQDAINKTAFELLKLIVVYPVEDANKWKSGKGNILPDAFLIPVGSNAYDMAVKIHTGFGPRFIAAIDCRSKQKLGKEHALKMDDVVKVQLSN